MIKVIKNNRRGTSKTDRLLSYHSFSFNDFYDDEMVNFGPIRVLNEDYVKAGAGFPTHPHKNMEIITYVLEGALQHKDSTGTDEIIYANEFQKMTAGSGIYHSEFNPSDTDDVHLLQIWIFPKTKNLPPSYDKLKLNERLEANKLIKVADNSNSDGLIFVDQDIEVYIAKFNEIKKLDFNTADNDVYLFNIEGNTKINDVIIEKGDALEITEIETLKIESSLNSHFILFKFPKN